MNHTGVNLDVQSAICGHFVSLLLLICSVCLLSCQCGRRRFRGFAYLGLGLGRL